MIENENNYSNSIIFDLIEEELSKGNKARFIVSGNSMAPWLIHNRDQVEIVAYDGLPLKKGDIILFTPYQGKYVLHRITKIENDGYITTGDGNLFHDGLVKKNMIIAKVIKIYRKDRVITCKDLRWIIISKIWMSLFPIRAQVWNIIKIIISIKV